MKLQAGIALTIVIALSGCTPLKPYERVTVSQLVGQWGEAKTNDCAVDPQTITFSHGMRTMYVTYKQSGTADGKTFHRYFKYSVLAASPDRVRMFLSGEQRVDAGGLPVTWDAVILSTDSFCWRRSDWAEDECTAPRIRCHKK